MAIELIWNVPMHRRVYLSKCEQLTEGQEGTSLPGSCGSSLHNKRHDWLNCFFFVFFL